MPVFSDENDRLSFLIWNNQQFWSQIAAYSTVDNRKEVYDLFVSMYRNVMFRVSDNDRTDIHLMKIFI